MKTWQLRPWRDWLQLFNAAANGWSDDCAPSMGAAPADYSVFSMVPLLVIVIAIAGLAFGPEAARGEVFGQLRGLMGDEPAKAVESMLESFSRPTNGIVSAVVGLALTTGAFAMIYPLMPRVSVQWKAVWRGAAITALLFTIGRFLIGLYIGKSGIAPGFGAAGWLAVIFVWVYYSAQISMQGLAEKRQGSTPSAVANANATPQPQPRKTPWAAM